MSRRYELRSHQTPPEPMSILSSAEMLGVRDAQRL